MSSEHSIPVPQWDDPTNCPFCQSDLPDPGAGFIDHVDENPDCRRGFSEWRDNVAGDMTGEWSG